MNILQELIATNGAREFLKRKGNAATHPAYTAPVQESVNVFYYDNCNSNCKSNEQSPESIIAELIDYSNKNELVSPYQSEFQPY